MAHFADFYAVTQKSAESATREVKQEVLRLLVESIVLEDETVTIKHIISTDEKCWLLSSDLSRIYPRVGSSERVRMITS